MPEQTADETAARHLTELRAWLTYQLGTHQPNKDKEPRDAR